MDHTCTTRKEHRNQDHDHDLDSSLASSGAFELGDNRSFQQLQQLQQQQPAFPLVKGDLAATMAAIHAAADLKLEMSSLPAWTSDLTAQMQENFAETRSHCFANSRTRPRDTSPRQEQLDISSLYRSIPFRASVDGLQSHPKSGGVGPGGGSGGLVSIPFSQQQVDMVQLPHRNNISNYIGFDSGLQSITSLVGGGSLDQCYSGVSPRCEKRQRLSPSSQTFHTPEGLTTIRDSLPASAAAAATAAASRGRGGGGAAAAAADGVSHLQGSGSAGQRGRNEQGLNEVLQRFTTSPSAQVQQQSTMAIKPVSPFDSLGLSEIAPSAPQFDNALLFSSSDSDSSSSRSLRTKGVLEGAAAAGFLPLQGGIKSLSSLTVKNSGATHDANTMEQLLVHCAQALDSNDVTVAQQIMFVLGNIAPADGDPNQRVTSCFLKALVRRAGRIIPDFSSMATVGRKSKVVSAVEYAGMIDITPWYRFGFKAANGLMMEAFEGKDRVHIIDFSTTYGMQWPTLIESLSERADGPPHVRLTVHKARPNIPPYLGMTEEEVANKLMAFASNRNVELVVNIIQHEVHQLDRSVLDIRDDETTVVNCMYRARYVPDESADPPNCSRDTFLRFIHSLDPALVIIVDEEATLTSTNLVARLKAAFNYIWIPFDALETFLPRDSPQRLEYELDLEKKIENIIACEGLQRIERLEAKDKWGQRMKKVGFELVPFSEDINSEVKSMLSDHAAGWGMKHDEDAMLLTWKGHNVLFATAWQPSFQNLS
ncbi:hypothetical protein Mapa_004529 [Marchantia paleacea]|nr:hypothetical protein Mapa_004529 [Marchantia paleacea]